jgi:hypothetical protein
MTSASTQQQAEPHLDVEELAADWHEALGRYHRTQCALDRALLAGHSTQAMAVCACTTWPSRCT